MNKELMKLPPMPAGYISPGMSSVYSASMMRDYAEQAVRESLAEQPAQQEPLTDAQIEQIFKENAGYSGNDFISFARAIEAKLKENT